MSFQIFWSKIWKDSFLWHDFCLSFYFLYSLPVYWVFWVNENFGKIIFEGLVSTFSIHFQVFWVTNQFPILSWGRKRSCRNYRITHHSNNNCSLSIWIYKILSIWKNIQNPFDLTEYTKFTEQNLFELAIWIVPKNEWSKFLYAEHWY